MPSITLLYASLLGLVMIGLAARIAARRTTLQVSLGDGGDQELQVRTRVFGNFVEYVPFALLLMSLIETSNGDSRLVHGAGLVLLVSRIAHAATLTGGAMNTVQLVGRRVGTLGTWLVVVLLCVYGVSLAV